MWRSELLLNELYRSTKNTPIQKKESTCWMIASILVAHQYRQFMKHNSSSRYMDAFLRSYSKTVCVRLTPLLSALTSYFSEELMEIVNGYIGIDEHHRILNYTGELNISHHVNHGGHHTALLLAMLYSTGISFCCVSNLKDYGSALLAAERMETFVKGVIVIDLNFRGVRSFFKAEQDVVITSEDAEQIIKNITDTSTGIIVVIYDTTQNEQMAERHSIMYTHTTDGITYHNSWGGPPTSFYADIFYGYKMPRGVCQITITYPNLISETINTDNEIAIPNFLQGRLRSHYV